MQTIDCETTCPECQVPYVDGGDEMVCPKCGLVGAKEVIDQPFDISGKAHSLSRSFLGSYMGTMRITPQERASQGIAGSNSRYEYLKVLSDYAGRVEGPEDACRKIISRVGEKLFLPQVVHDEAAKLARTVIASNNNHRRMPLAAVSAFCLATACKIEGVSSVSVREIIAAHAALGRRVDSSSYIQIALESPIRATPRRPDDYFSKVIARLSSDRALSERLKLEGVAQTRYLNSLRDAAKELLELVSPGELSGRRPCSLAAAAIYSAELFLSSREHRRRRLTQRLVAECGDAAEYTIREQCATIFTPVAASLMQSGPATPHALIR